jgi:hypothetical protein
MVVAQLLDDGQQGAWMHVERLEPLLVGLGVGGRAVGLLGSPGAGAERRGPRGDQSKQEDQQAGPPPQPGDEGVGPPGAGVCGSCRQLHDPLRDLRRCV